MAEAAELRACALSLSGPITVDTAPLIWRLLAYHLEVGATCELHAHEVVRLDGAGAQLLYAFVHEVERRGSMVRWVSASVEMIETARMLGMAELLGLTEEALAWRP